MQSSREQGDGPKLLHGTAQGTVCPLSHQLVNLVVVLCGLLCLELGQALVRSALNHLLSSERILYGTRDRVGAEHIGEL